jgi:hypothetical protein
MHYHNGRWYNWDSLPADSNDSDFGIQTRLLNEIKPGAEG